MFYLSFPIYSHFITLHSLLWIEISIWHHFSFSSKTSISISYTAGLSAFTIRSENIFILAFIFFILSLFLPSFFFHFAFVFWKIFTLDMEFSPDRFFLILNMPFHSLLECFLWEVNCYSYHLSPIFCLFRLIWIPLRYLLLSSFWSCVIFFVFLFLEICSPFFLWTADFLSTWKFLFFLSRALISYFSRIPNTCNLNSLFLSKAIETLFFYFYSFSLCVYLQIISTDLSWNSLTLFSILSNLH